MAFKKTYAVVAAGVAVALVAAPMSASAVDDADPTTGNVTITKFDDRYADGLFDTTKTAPSGDQDRLGEGTINLIDAKGTRHYSSGTNGVFAFENVPVGPATAYITYPNGPGGEVLFDATGAKTATDIKRIVPGSYMGSPNGALPITVDADGETRLVGLSALRLAATVKHADGTPASGVTVELGSDQWYPATEYDFASGKGTYEANGTAGNIRHLPGDLRLRVTAPKGSRVASVTASNNAGATAPITVTKKQGVYSFSSTQVLNYFWNPEFVVTLAADATKPVLKVPADGSVIVGAEFDPRTGVTATDDGGDGDLMAAIAVQGKVDTSKTGTYALTYSVTDEAGNTATATRTVTVVEGTLSAPTPTVSGSPRVGSTLTATPGSWTPGTALTYAWALNGAPVVGATSARLQLTPSMAGGRVTVTVTGARPGYTTAQRTSSAVTVAKGALSSSKPRIDGSAKVGKTLKVKVGRWSPEPSFRYTWYANGRIVKTTTSPNLKVSKKWAGMKLKVKATGTLAGYTTKSVTSSSTSKVTNKKK
jgi:hypothetical protein